MDIAAYLQRINYEGVLSPTPETLRSLHRAHMLTVPFENLDIHLQRPIRLEQTALFQKIVKYHRGGFCYELNGLFAELLQELGFDVVLLSAQVAKKNGTFGPEFDHLALLVQLEDLWLADVGFGDSFLEPLLLKGGLEQTQDGKQYRVLDEGGYWLMQPFERNSWHTQFRFTLKPRQLTDFLEMCRHHERSPESAFIQRRVCSRATPDGRVTLTERGLILTHYGEKREITFMDEHEYPFALEKHFGIRLESNVSEPYS